jgi:hypothetical protein
MNSMNNISFLNIILFAIFTIIMMMLLIFLVGVINYKEIIRIVGNEKIEMFESEIILDKQSNNMTKVQTNSESIMNALTGVIKTANKVGKKMLDPELWSERLKLINKSPMELARMHLTKE